MPKTTHYDLNKTATAAAESAIGKDALAVASIKLEAFQAAGHDRVDYPLWADFFQTSLTTIAQQKITLSPAGRAAENAELAAKNTPAQ